ncbi:hypothetical protein QIT38_gp24 [Methanocaldococcus fervens tailed virus 1]|uniref:Uncharacterized protein n=2 Tax=root TaxID=1 RepID=C7P5I6_METFA|nr:hypothetical protein [Methanocaldococcus fervens]YP_010772319.1 hypothetical protein QIT38_gp24 [Methanocaldococcus fervens tailed virus 1]ACV25364.1 hypothetical protein Mefer_1561 [Methanocaldococcus fervens AG86]QNO11494.1 hypothetical protein [Methanocaldococcus fervens tailed virus 1]
MAIAYAKLYELILKKVKDEKEAREFYDVIIELMKEGKIEVKNELKDELRGELATKEDVKYLEGKIDMVKKELEYKLIIHTLIILFAIIITNPNAIELIKLLFGFK